MRITQVLALAAALGPLLPAADNSDAPPSPEEQAKLLEGVRDYAANYTRRLPDFICMEQTRRYADTTGSDAWRLSDSITARLSYFNQKEDYRLVSQNGRAVKDASYASVDGVFSMGDFGTAMRDIFDPANHATFAWERPATIRGRRTQVLSYRVPLRLYTIQYQGEPKDAAQSTRVSYRGLVFVDERLQTIMRITHEALSIPPSFPVRAATETLDYDFVRIGDSEFFLPLVATLQMRVQTFGGAVWMKNVKEFQLYRKFSADAAIKFDGEELPPQPQPPQ
jgi:hypothetical protein